MQENFQLTTQFIFDAAVCKWMHHTCEDFNIEFGMYDVLFQCFVYQSLNLKT